MCRHKAAQRKAGRVNLGEFIIGALNGANAAKYKQFGLFMDFSANRAACCCLVPLNEWLPQQPSAGHTHTANGVFAITSINNVV